MNPPIHNLYKQRKFEEKKSIKTLFYQQLSEEKEVALASMQELEGAFKAHLENAFLESKNMDITSIAQERLLGNRWSFWREKKLLDPQQFFDPVDTKVALKEIQALAEVMNALPSDFHPHKKILSLLEMRKKALLGESKVLSLDWGLAENLAYATLLKEQYPIRIAGQDCCRGTFSHRHAMVVDQNDGQEYFPLQHLTPDQAPFTVYNSPLSEYACLGFEYGYSISSRSGLVIWEAQFGDFANGAQIMIDAYIAAAEEKWNRLSDLVLLLPHGYEGQGPEHSSARVERYLQLSGNNNIQVVNPTTPAQLFHLLRRQAKKSFRKPLIVFTPKGLLRHKRCMSSLEEISGGSFQEILPDPSLDKGRNNCLF